MDEGEVEMAEDQELEFGSKTCVCPQCGAVVPHMERGKPCSARTCPECGSVMKGEQCR
jgi:ribosomal protein S27AE